MNWDSVQGIGLRGAERTAFRLGLGLAMCLAVAGCSDTNNTQKPAVNTVAQANAGNFTRTVFLGDSLTAGYQSSSLLDTQQVHGYAPLVGAQAGFTVALPLIAFPGAPNVLQLKSVSPLTITAAPGKTTGRDDFGLQPTDVAVPGAFVNDVANTVPLLTPTTGQEQLNQLVLGYPGFGFGKAYSQAQQAIAADPTTIFLWIGNNDALIADLTGTPASMTSTANFTSQYTALITLLTTKTNAHLVIGNIPDVTLVPYLQPAALVLAETAMQTGVPAANLSVLLGIAAGDYVTPEGLGEIPLILGQKQAGPISDAGVLSAAEVVTVKAQVMAFNQVIADQAKAAGATLVDINGLFNTIATSGLTVGGFPGTANFLGGFFSLDGIHPTNTGYGVVANKFIDSMNAGIGTKIPDVDLVPIAAADPLWPPNLAGK